MYLGRISKFPHALLPQLVTKDLVGYTYIYIYTDVSRRCPVIVIHLPMFRALHIPVFEAVIAESHHFSTGKTVKLGGWAGAGEMGLLSTMANLF